MFGMEQLRARIARLEAQVRVQGEAINVMARRLGIEPVAVDPISHLDPEELDLARTGKQIQAIKHHRKRTGSSLLEAKNAVDGAIAS